MCVFLTLCLAVSLSLSVAVSSSLWLFALLYLCHSLSFFIYCFSVSLYLSLCCSTSVVSLRVFALPVCLSRWCLLFCHAVFLSPPSWVLPPPNTRQLFIVVDDLRPELGVYNSSIIHTPHIDALARSPGAAVFANAFTQQAICCPSRTSFLTGRRPDTTRVWDLIHNFRHTGGNFTTLPQAFKDAGYRTAGG